MVTGLLLSLVILFDGISQHNRMVRLVSCCSGHNINNLEGDFSSEFLVDGRTQAKALISLLVIAYRVNRYRPFTPREDRLQPQGKHSLEIHPIRTPTSCRPRHSTDRRSNTMTPTPCPRMPFPSLSSNDLLSRGAAGHVFKISRTVVPKSPTKFDNPLPPQSEEMEESARRIDDEKHVYRVLMDNPHPNVMRCILDVPESYSCLGWNPPPKTDFPPKTRLQPRSGGFCS